MADYDQTLHQLTVVTSNEIENEITPEPEEEEEENSVGEDNVSLVSS